MRFLVILAGLAAVVAGVWWGGPWVLAGAFGGALVVLGLRSVSARGSRAPSSTHPRLQPESALEWLRLAHDAFGAWAVESGPRGRGLAGYQSVDPHAPFDDARLRTIERRLLELRDRDGGGGERTDEGTLVFEAFGGMTAGLMLRRDHSPADLERAHVDLRHLLDGLTRRPVLHTQAQDEDAPVEGSRSIALRLAHQIERALGAECVVALTEPGGARIASVTSGADGRLVGRLLPADSPLGRVATGSARSLEVGGGAWVGPSADRRELAQTRAMLLHLQDEGHPIGAVAFWNASGAPIAPHALTEAKEILLEAEPRFRAARLVEATRLGAQLDAVTGLPTRRSFDQAVGEREDAPGAVVMADVGLESVPAEAREAALVYLGQTLRHVVRGTDLASHYGAERFALWLPGADVAAGVRVANRVRQRMEHVPWEWGGSTRSLTVAFGVAGCPESSARTTVLAEKAQQALRSGAGSPGGRVSAAPAIT